MSQPEIRRALSVAVLCLLLPGCFGLLVGDPHQWAYVSRMGNADTIGHWTMQQTQCTQIYNGLGALSERMVTANDLGEVDDAKEWYLKVLNRIEDWPEDYVIPDNSGRACTTKQLIQRVFTSLSFNGYHDLTMEGLLHRVRPDKDHSQWLSIWVEAVENLERARRGEREIWTESSPRILSTQPNSQ